MQKNYKAQKSFTQRSPSFVIVPINVLLDDTQKKFTQAHRKKPRSHSEQQVISVLSLVYFTLAPFIIPKPIYEVEKNTMAVTVLVLG